MRYGPYLLKPLLKIRMTYQRFILPFIVFLIAIATIGCADKEIQDTPPNVIIVFTDDQGYQDLGCFGSPDIKTPHIDQLAKEGVKLTDFSVAQPVCSASRAALLTGCYPNRIGVHQALMPEAPSGLNQSETTMAELLKAE